MILANLFAQDFIWAGLSFCCWDGKIIYDTFTTSKPPSQVWDDWEWFQWVSLPAESHDASGGPAPVATEWGRDVMRSPQLDTGQTQPHLSRQICNKIRLLSHLSPFWWRVLSQLAGTCSWASLPESHNHPMSSQTRRRVTRPITKHGVTMNTRQRFL